MVTPEQINKYNELREEATREVPSNYLEKICVEANKLAASDYQNLISEDMANLREIEPQVCFSNTRHKTKLYSTYKIENIHQYPKCWKNS